MAEKRAKDRVILKLVGLHGLLYSEEEADEFKSSAASVAVSETAAQGEEEQPQGVEPTAKSKSGKGKAKGAQGGADELKRKIDKAGSINAVTDLMLLPETQKSLNELPVAVRDDIRDYAKARLIALGWPAKQAARLDTSRKISPACIAVRSALMAHPASTLNCAEKGAAMRDAGSSGSCATWVCRPREASDVGPKPRTAAMTCRLRPTGSVGPLWPSAPTLCGWPTSRTSRPTRGFSIWRPSRTWQRARLSAGRWPITSGQACALTPWSWPSGRGTSSWGWAVRRSAPWWSARRGSRSCSTCPAWRATVTDRAPRTGPRSPGMGLRRCATPSRARSSPYPNNCDDR